MQKSEIVPFGYDDQLVRTVMIDDTPLESPVLGLISGTPARFSTSLLRSARAMSMLGW